MILYSIIILYTLCLAYIYSHLKTRKWVKAGNRFFSPVNMLWFLAMVLPATLVMGFRYGISIDYPIYINGFYKVVRGEYTLSETGFQYFEKLCALISGNEPWSLFLLSSLITVICFFLSFRRSANYLFSAALFFGVGIYFDAFNGVRQYIVVAIFVIMYQAIEEGNWKKYYLLNALCVLIHTSALLLAPLYFLTRVKINKYWVLVIAALMLVFKGNLVSLITRIMARFPKYNAYLLRNTLGRQINFSTSGLVFAIISVIPCIINEKRMEQTGEGRFLFSLMHIGLILAVSSSFLPFAERLLYYTRGYMPIAIPYACSLFTGKRRTLSEYVISGMTLGMTIIGIVMLNWYAVLPYQSIFTR